MAKPPASPMNQPIRRPARTLIGPDPSSSMPRILHCLLAFPGRRSLALLIVGMVLVICATAAAQVGLNAWNRPFYEAIAERNFPAFLYQLLIFAAIAASLLVLN